MKKFIIILFAISMYMPDASQILDLSQCVFAVLATSKGEICDCMLTSQNQEDINKSKSSSSHTHKHTVVKQIDKYCSQTKYYQFFVSNKISLQHFSGYKNLLSNKHLPEIFRPPVFIIS